MMYHVVVARYREDVDAWTRGIDPLFVYDKSPSPDPRFIARPNRGREVSSFMEHIILHYDDLPEYLIFLQGDPFPHMKGVDNVAARIQEAVDARPQEVQPFCTSWYHEQHYHYPSIKAPEYFSFLFDADLPPVASFASGCQYIVPRSQVIARPLSFYKRLHAMLLRGDHFSMNEASWSPYPFTPWEMNGWTFERLMGYVFRSDIPLRVHPEKRFLVTGGAGFIGSNLVDRLLRDGHTVVVIDNLSTGSRANLQVHENLLLVEQDILECDIMTEIGYVDGVFHLQAMSKVLPSLGNVDMVDFCLRQNAFGSLRVLEYAYRHHPPCKVVYSASSTYYGNGAIPNTETNPHDCQTPYATSKYVGELLMELFARLYHVPTVRLRYFMVFGNRQPSSGPYAIVSGIFADRARRREVLEIHGDGSQSRDFVSVLDVVEANVRAMTSDRLTDETINVGTGKATTIKELADAISTYQVHTPPRPVDLRATLADTRRCEALLGWVPGINILRELVQFTDTS